MKTTLNKIKEQNPSSIENADTMTKATGWVVNVVDTSVYDKRKEDTLKREYIIQQLMDTRGFRRTTAIYKLLAKSDRRQ